eukprot:TRINITY_DN4782_c0_g1_i1.p1 TRINITY_DN4782_c0_g1~~TRINITY_DN4782_c0_g1_i1.p1  ORF type:complete len:427 (-),score=51.88 TRINITY_DN4782_c0_g1_i1:152-1402(-)
MATAGGTHHNSRPHKTRWPSPPSLADSPMRQDRMRLCQEILVGRGRLPSPRMPQCPPCDSPCTTPSRSCSPSERSSRTVSVNSVDELPRFSVPLVRSSPVASEFAVASALAISDDVALGVPLWSPKDATDKVDELPRLSVPLVRSSPVSLEFAVASALAIRDDVVLGVPLWSPKDATDETKYGHLRDILPILAPLEVLTEAGNEDQLDCLPLPPPAGDGFDDYRWEAVNGDQLACLPLPPPVGDGSNDYRWEAVHWDQLDCLPLPPPVGDGSNDYRWEVPAAADDGRLEVGDDDFEEISLPSAPRKKFMIPPWRRFVSRPTSSEALYPRLVRTRSGKRGPRCHPEHVKVPRVAYHEHMESPRWMRKELRFDPTVRVFLEDSVEPKLPSEKHSVDAFVKWSLLPAATPRVELRRLKS